MNYSVQTVSGGLHSLTIATFTSPTFSGLNDTSFLDIGLNTVSTGYSYKVDFYVVGDELLGSSDPGTSIYLVLKRTGSGVDIGLECQSPLGERYLYRLPAGF